MPRDDSGCAGGAVAWLRRWWRALVSELAATALLVWLGLASLVPLGGAEAVPLANVALAFGFAVLGNAVAFGPTSGAHMNPAVTLAALLYGQIGAAPAAAYALAQLVGAALGFGALLAVMPEAAMRESRGVTLPAVPAWAAVCAEALLTGALVLALCGVWAAHDPARPDPTVPLKIGSVVAALVFAGGPATGASLNPARSFGPALLQGDWRYHWVYWLGPLGGAALAALLHRFVLSAPRAEPRRRSDVELPLGDKP